jgi:hypothetical protein
VPYRARLIVIAVLLSLASVAVPAWAGESADALIRKGLELRKRGDDLGALPLFEQAYRITPSPRAAAQRGFCEQALGRWTHVEAHLAEALKTPDDPWVKKNRSAIDESLRVAKTKVAVIEVVGDPTGSEVLVNGNVVGKLPLPSPIRIESGEIDVELRHAGYRPASKTLRVDGGQYQRIVVRAELEPPPAPPAPPPPAPASPASPPSVSVYVAPTTGGTQMVSSRAAEPVSGWRTGAKWVSWGLGAAALGVGFYGLRKNGELVDEFKPSCAIDATGAYPRAGATVPRDLAWCQSTKSDYEAAGRLGVAGFVGAGILGAAGVILYMTEPDSRDGRTALSCVPGVGTQQAFSFGCALRF